RERFAQLTLLPCKLSFEPGVILHDHAIVRGHHAEVLVSIEQVAEAARSKNDLDGMKSSSLVDHAQALVQFFRALLELSPCGRVITCGGFDVVREELGLEF